MGFGRLRWRSREMGAPRSSPNQSLLSCMEGLVSVLRVTGDCDEASGVRSRKWERSRLRTSRKLRAVGTRYRITGTWHQVSAKHLPAYLDEMTWQFNDRKNPFLFRDRMLKLI